MARVNGEALFFDEEDVRSTTALLPRLIRVFMFGLRIKHDEYMHRYWTFWRSRHHGESIKKFRLKSSSDRGFLANNTNVTYAMVSNVIDAMGYDIREISMTVVDRVSGEVKTFSTSDTVEKLNSEHEKKSVVGIESL